MGKIRKLMDEYNDKFGEYFPLMEVYGMEDAEIAKIIRECIKTGKPYEPEPYGSDVLV